MTKASNALLIGDFAPLHLGHLADINHAAGIADTLHIVITPPAHRPLPSGRAPNLSDVARWVQVACQQFGFIKVHTTQSLGLDIAFDCQEDTRACPYLDNEAKNRLNRQQNKANCADNIGILSNNLTQFCQI